MKKTAILAGLALFISFSAISQTEETPDTVVTAEATDTTDEVATTQTSKYELLPMPEPLTIEKIFPVLGHYKLTTAGNTEQNITILLDPENKGIVWVDGLPEGRFKAYLAKSPTTYRIPPQKNEAGDKIAEGTLYYDRDINLLQVCVGCKYDQENPLAVFQTTVATEEGSTAKTKVSGKSYTAQKTDVGVASQNTPATQTTEYDEE